MDVMMTKTQQMGTARSEDRQQGEAARKRPQQQGSQQKPAQHQGSVPTQQSGGDSGSGQMNSTQFTDWASI